MSFTSMNVQTGLELIIQRKIIWKIDKFNIIVTNPSLVHSQKFQVEMEETSDLPKTSWGLSLASRDNEVKVCYFPKLQDVKIPGNTPKIIVHKGTASIVDVKGKKFKSFEGPGITYVLNPSNPDVNIGHPGIIFLLGIDKDISKLPLIDGDTSILLEIYLEIYKNREPDSSLFDGNWVRHAHKKAKSDYVNLLSGDLGDVTIISKDKEEFRAHKLILRARSEVFEGMFRSSMTESATGVIRLDDLSSPAVKFLLHYIYGFTPLADLVTFFEKPEDQNDNMNRARINVGAENDNEVEEIPGPPQKIPRMMTTTDEPATVAKKGRVTAKEVLHIATKYGFDELRNWVDYNLRSHCCEKNAWYLFDLCKTYSLKSKEIVKYFITRHPCLVRQLIEDDNDAQVI